ncbi:hypothetical protein SAMN06265377_3680 [Flagellimonas pacifica]|uniref:Uncharacterized protein n=1 Tax=Flagellimonas pacifica TaxID=1247520 RepID=A0A285N275_9FLAO|nr:hypothetical protein SAMN06265377_3680 [Allomuricauda parva]
MTTAGPGEAMVGVGMTLGCGMDGAGEVTMDGTIPGDGTVGVMLDIMAGITLIGAIPDIGMDGVDIIITDMVDLTEGIMEIEVMRITAAEGDTPITLFQEHHYVEDPT